MAVVNGSKNNGSKITGAQIAGAKITGVCSSCIKNASCSEREKNARLLVCALCRQEAREKRFFACTKGRRRRESLILRLIMNFSFVQFSAYLIMFYFFSVERNYYNDLVPLNRQPRGNSVRWAGWRNMNLPIWWNLHQMSRMKKY